MNEKDTRATELKSLCKELVDDLDAWLEYDEKPSSSIAEYEDSIRLVKRARNTLKNL